MTENQKFMIGTILGAAAGAGLALFLSSSKGKDVMNQAKDMYDTSFDKLKHKATDFVNHIKHNSKERSHQMV